MRTIAATPTAPAPASAVPKVGQHSASIAALPQPKPIRSASISSIGRLARGNCGPVGPGPASINPRQTQPSPASSTRQPIAITFGRANQTASQQAAVG